MIGKASDGKPPIVVRLENENGLSIELMDIGATWLSCKIPLSEGAREVLLGVDNMDDFYRQSAYFGASVGRYANRIAQGRFELGNRTYQVSQNQPPHCLHGGESGFDKRRWTIARQDKQCVVFTLTSPDGDQGFPSELSVKARYEVTDDNRVVIEYSASAQSDTIVALTNHAYFNLDGEGDVLEHQLQLSADSYLPVGEDGIPESGVTPVVGTGFDFRAGKTIMEDLLTDEDQQKVGGYDHSFLLSENENFDNSQCQLTSSDGIVSLGIATNQEAIQVYTGNFLADEPGRDGTYHRHEGVALETQCLPNSPNTNLEACLLKAGDLYLNRTEFRFSFKR
ncbi:galactose-1-epimerase (Galactose mutarotase) [Vibrio nigripulchritudo SO65]|uniref:galactose-1-epimerase n=1 Tax=Vibrio nigripulchritudo TaxID=28173 RepID=UPI0003B1AAB3|nr:galactose-1-epimerase [Vibrio nigripulchritudo]CCN34153.1 galactose-1-epimerase (Galactose mutarotase) [Vibrio nigripulchritudo AM115]CCN44141.1 galactose-1-epimerase (Galactose mutarotase) [Vibrio nigripulchritudo FTn2]CCN67031.1 galactose-1-epimerase (Galactose mutarotase) [Vibrio nigripulchritudo POn4]CCN74175.1 galactose-1-epimerase (Galactose mutarotase) [Vibrio nigripulchritudo SO65]